MERACPSCGTENPAASRFCGSCGARLDAPPHEERKLVSVLFVDLVGFTAESENADPEDVRETLQRYFAEARRRIEPYGGVLEKFIGDAVMAVFGAPVAHGDDAERAVRAGLRVLEAVEALGLAARAAVCTGDAVVAVNAQGGEALATGDVVNTASRLQSAAPTGRLIVGDETYRATRHAIRYEAHEPVDAKGKSSAVAAWLALEPAAAETPPLRPLVGRARELELVESAWARCVSEQRPHLVSLIGPPGIGKSRLCHELAGLVARDAGRIVRGRCLPYEEQAGYQAFSRVVHALSGILESDPPAVARVKLEAAVERTMPPAETADTVRYLALLLGLAPDDEVPQPLLLFFAARRFVECAGAMQPTVLVLEDLHWAQSSELALVEYLSEHLRESPVMLVATARPELLDAQPTWGSGLAARTTIPLEPLSPGDAATLAAQLVPGRDVTRLVEIAGGNPLFLEELALGESDKLPVTVREAIAGRIDAVPPDARDVLLTAAVVGKTFWRGVLQAAGGVEDVDEALVLLEARDLIRRDAASQLSGDVQFTFKHMLIREVAYGTVPRAVRREWHAAVARYVETTIAGAAETLASILAYHWREAGEPARAIPYLLAAADAARRSWAQGAVVDLYSKALDLADDDALRRRIRMLRAVALLELGDYPQAREELAPLVDELTGKEKLDALIAYGHAMVWTESPAEHTLALVAEAAPLAAELGDETAVAAVLAMESQALAMRGAEGDLDDAYEIGERSLDMWVREKRPDDLRHQLHLHASTAWWTGRYARAIELSQETRALGADVRSAESLLRGGGMEALASCGLGRHEEAIAIWDELLRIAEELGQNPRVVLNYSAVAYRELNDLDEARRRTEQALELSLPETFGMPKQFAGSDLLITHLLAGDVGRAQAEWPVVWERAAEATGWTTWLIAGRLAYVRAEIALLADGADAATEHIRNAVAIARRTRRRKYEAHSLVLLGRALAELGQRDDALAALRSAVEIADELIGPPARWDARAALGAAAYALGDDDTAARAYDEAGELVEAFVPTLAPERAARLLAAPVVDDILSRAGRRPVA